MGEQADDRGLPSGFQRSGDENMSDQDLDATAEQVDPDDIGGSAEGPGLTAGGTGTEVDVDRPVVSEGGSGSAGNTYVTGGESGGTLGGESPPRD